jgi:hypothetical protein
MTKALVRHLVQQRLEHTGAPTLLYLIGNGDTYANVPM